ncbi:MAG: HEAT repeat domain-containing protein [Ferruginibacter sp.]|nr:HEAT repeat domain-containing protein [Cytophagales bacterium]
MDCEKAKVYLVDWLAGQVEGTERGQLEDHLSGCPECREELNALRQVWQTMGEMPVPEPSEQLRIRFYSMLGEYKALETRSRQPAGGWLRRWQPAGFYRLAYSFGLLGMGLVAGYWFNARRSVAQTNSGAASQQQLRVLSGEVQQMRETMLFTLIENPSATERLRAVGYTKEIERVDERVVDALLGTLNHDPNVNVRLVTLEALSALAANPRVRQGLVRSITRQESPLVQSALVDVMVELQEKRSVEGLRQLLRDKGLNASVKLKIENGLQRLI